MSSKKPSQHIATRSVRAGLESDAQHGSVVPPIYLSTNFAFEGYRRPRKYDYTRSGNPTRDQLGLALADLEGGAGAVVTCTGLAAITLILAALPAGARVVAPYAWYGGPYRLLNALHAKGNLVVDFVDQSNSDELRAALALQPKLVWIETPSNPLLRVVDIRGAGDAAHRAGGLAAALVPGRRFRDALDHQVPQRPQRCGGGCGDCGDGRAAPESLVVGQRHWCDRSAIRQLSDPARCAQFAREDARSRREHGLCRAVSNAAAASAARLLSRS